MRSTTATSAPTGNPDAASVSQPALEPARAHHAIAAIVKQLPDRRAGGGLALLRQMTGGKGAYLVRFGEDGEARIQLGEGLTEPGLIERVEAVAGKVRQDRVAQVVAPEKDPEGLVIASVPLVSRRTIDSCICLAVPSRPERDRRDLIVTLQWFSVLFYGADEEGLRLREKEAALRIAGYIEAVEGAVSALDFPGAASRIVESFRIQARCDRVVLATRRFGRVGIRAISGVSSSDTPKSEAVTAMERLLRESIRGDREVGFGENPAGLEIPEMRVLGAARGLSLPLSGDSGIVGAWLFLWKEEPEDLEDRIRFLRTASALLGPQITLLQRTKPGAFGGRLRRLWRKAGTGARFLTTAVLTFLVLVALWPVPLPVSGACTLHPEKRRIIAAPFDGILRRALVEPGQMVGEGQLLAELDGREIRWKLADTQAQRLRAEKQADAAINEGRIADHQMALLEAEGLAESAKVLRYRQENLQIRSPLEGRILRGDLEREVGATVRMGETLFEVGSLESMLVEIEVHESDIALVRQGAETRFRFDSRPGRVWRAKVEVISPRSEYRNGANVFLCRARIDNSEGWMRPGGLGRARISGPRRPAIWALLREPTHWMMRWLP